MNQTEEGSVQDILESIKKVIARDNRARATDRRRHREDSTRDVGMASPLDVTSSALSRDCKADDILDLADRENWLVSGNENEQSDEAAQEPLINADARASMRETLAALSMLAEPGASPQIVRSGETSLEGLVRDLLRPALAEWLDQHLPPLVERLVASEIARIVRKKG